MTSLPGSRALVALFCSITLIGRAQDGPAPEIERFLPNTEAEVTALLRATGIQPIRFSESTKWARELVAETDAWLERWALPPVTKRLKEKPYGDKAIDFVNRAWALVRGEGPDMDAAGKLRKEGAVEFWGKDISDPYVNYFMARLGASSGISNKLTREIAGGAVSSLAKTHEDPELAAFDLVAMRQAQEYGYLDQKTRARALKRFEQLLALRAFDGQTRAAIEYGSTVISLLPESGEDLMKLITAAGFPAWVTETLLGKCEQEIAWRWRGIEYAPQVTRQGWDGFYAHLKLARAHLVKAWDLNPKEPDAACLMITNLMGAGPRSPEIPPGETLQLWHSRAIAASGDYYEAYTRLRDALLPKWHGSVAHQLALGYACADAGPDVTSVPRMFEAIIMGYARGVEDRSRVLHNPTVAKRLIRFGEDSLKAARPDRRNAYRGRLAVFGWMTGNYSVAANALSGLDGTLPKLVREYLDGLELSPAAFAGESILRSGPWRAIYETALLARKNEHYDDARLLFGSLLFFAPPNALPHVGEMLKVAAAERELETGQWVTLAGNGRVCGWVVSEGDVDFNSRGNIRMHGADERLRAFFTGRVNTDFAMRGSARLTPRESAPSKYLATFGIVFDRNAIGAGPSARSAITMEIKPTKPGVGNAVLTFAGKEMSAPVEVSLRPENEFEFTRSGKEVRFRWNGTEAVAEMPPHHVPPNNASIGLGWSSQGAGAFTEITHLEVRNLKAAL